MDDYIICSTVTPSQLVEKIKEFSKNPRDYKSVWGDHEVIN